MLQLIKKLFGVRAPPVPPPPPPAPPLPALRVPRAVDVDAPLTLEALLELMPGHRIPVPAAVSLILRLCALLPGDREPLEGMHPRDIHFLPDGGLLIAGALRFRRPRRGLHTLNYLTPERLMERPLDERSEVFSFAILLHECLAGERLFAGFSDFAVLEAVRTATLPPRPETIPLLLHAVLLRALEAAPAARFKSVKEFSDALQPFAGASTLDALLDGLIEPAPVPAAAVPETLLSPDDEGARLVYADWLEEQGQPDQASWLRQESRLRSLEGERLQAALRQLRELNDKVGTTFITSVARTAIEGCAVRFGFKCPLKWESLQRTDREEVRHCVGCRQDVHFVRTVEEVRALSSRGGCIAFDPTQERSDQERDPGQYVLGQGAF